MQIKVWVGRADAIKAGNNKYGERLVEVDVSKLSQEQRDVLAQKTRSSSESLNLVGGVATEEEVVRTLDALIESQRQATALHAASVESCVQRFLALTQAQVNDLRLYDWDKVEREALADPRLADQVAVRVAYLTAQEREADAEAARRRVSEAEWEARREEGKRQAAVLAAQREAGRAEWIGEHGSEHLKLALAGGYKCNSLYLRERVALELGEGWVVDTGDRAETEERCNPSLEALQAVQGLPEGYVGQVVWLTASPRGDDEDWEPCEAVEVTLPYSGHKAYKS